jgi:hypothetical protein
MIDSLGKFEHDGHKIWEWRYDRLNDRVLRQNGDLVEVFVGAAATASNTGRNRMYHFSHTASEDLSGLDICTITPVSNTSLKVASHAKDSTSDPLPETFLDVLDDWGCTWLWEKLRVTGATGTGMNMAPGSHYRLRLDI